jgi:uncharacterized membrane protein YagU involved in acid resistance
MNQRPRVWAVLVGGAIGGALDILFAITFAYVRGMAPDRLLQTVASGLLGNAAFDGGIPVAVLGLASHFVMSCTWAAIFVLAAGHFHALTRRPILSGILFGIVVFLTMRLVVLPLSAFPYPLSFKPLATTLDLLSHMLLFGVPIALAARASATRSSSSDIA